MKKTIFIAIFSASVIPSFAFAAWWAPWTWGKHPVPEAVVSTTTNETTATTTIVTVEKPIYKDRVVTQTITVQDPALQAKIDDLIRENELLKNQYNECISKSNVVAQASPTNPIKDNLKSKIAEFALLQLEVNNNRYNKFGDLKTLTDIDGKPFFDLTNQFPGGRTYEEVIDSLMDTEHGEQMAATSKRRDSDEREIVKELGAEIDIMNIQLSSM